MADRTELAELADELAGKRDAAIGAGNLNQAYELDRQAIAVEKQLNPNWGR
jgi:hypothetical protein